MMKYVGFYEIKYFVARSLTVNLGIHLYTSPRKGKNKLKTFETIFSID